jgi:hypothetical protein
MKLPVYILMALLALPAAGGAAAEKVAWKDPRHAAQFCYFIEQGSPDEKAWEAMPAEAQEAEFRKAEYPAARKLEALTKWYGGVMRKWTTGQLRNYTAKVTRQDLDTVKLWLGDYKAAEMKKKLTVTSTALFKAERGGLQPGDDVTLAPYLTPIAIGDLHGIKAAQALRAQTGAPDAKEEARKAELSARLDKLSSAVGQPSSGGSSKFFDGSKTASGAPVYAGSQPVKPVTKSVTSAPAALPVRARYVPPSPADTLTQEFSGQRGYQDMKKDNEYRKVMKEVDKDGEDAAAKGRKIKAAGYAALNSVYNVSKDFDETFVHNPAPRDADVQRVIDRIKSNSKNPDEAWQLAYTMRQKRDFPALRDAEHYLWACSEANESRWHAARTVITTPMYSAAKLPGLRKIFFDDDTSPPSASEIKWGWKGVKDCVK